MIAKSLSIHELLSGSKNFRIPIFQRHYEWLSLEVDAGGQVEDLWSDIETICLRGKKHFIGPFVTKRATRYARIHAASQNGHDQATPVYLVIDGQQRLTTLLILLCVIRDFAQQLEHKALANTICETYLVNSTERGDKKLRLVSSETNKDNQILTDLLLNKESAVQVESHPIHHTRTSFQAHVQRYLYSTQPEHQAKTLQILLQQIVTNLSAVEIQLEREDNPTLIFQSLNSKGRDLTSSDLSSSYIFMKLSSEAAQKRMHQSYWRPMELRLLAHSSESPEEVMDQFLRTYLCAEHPDLRERDVYNALEAKVGQTDFEIETLLIRMSDFAEYYALLFNPELEKNPTVRLQLTFLQNLGYASLHPFLLNLFHHARGRTLKGSHHTLSEKEFILLLRLMESLIIRRFVCGENLQKLHLQMNRIYHSSLSGTDHSSMFDHLLVNMIEIFPQDEAFEEALLSAQFQTSGLLSRRVRYMLRRIEFKINPYSDVLMNSHSIEHIMPHNLTNWWRKELGDGFSKVHVQFLDNLGNLTLVPLRGTLSNRRFPEKKVLLKETTLKINEHFQNIKKWKKGNMQKRAQELAEHALELWQHPSTVNI
ncbi:MAG: DUF262 domain-containing HNH endonuclease family protein [Verrucomicrobiota bacterium]